MAGPGPVCTWEQDHTVQDGTMCLAESRLPGTVQRRSPALWERGLALYQAYERAQELAPEAILRHTGHALGEVLKGLLPGLLEMLVVLAATTAIGALAGGVIGFFFGGAGAAPGVVIGGDIGFDVGLAALTWLGVAFLVKAMIEGLGQLWNQLSLGARHAWEAPEYPDRDYPHKIEEAAKEFADAAGILMLLLLQAVVAWVLKRAAMGATRSAAQSLSAVRTVGSEAAAEAAVAELVARLRVSRLGSGFADWVEKNWPKLRDDPRLRFRPRSSGTTTEPPPPAAGGPSPSSAAAAATPKGPVKPYETGTFKDLKARSQVGDGLDIDHQPSKAALLEAAEQAKGAPLTEAEKAAVINDGPAVAVPESVHRAGPTYGGRNTPAQISTDAQDLGAAAARDADAMVQNAAPADKAAAQQAADKIKAIQW